MKQALELWTVPAKSILFSECKSSYNVKTKILNQIFLQRGYD